MKEFKKTNIPGFAKDPKTNTVINTDMSAYQTLLTQRQRFKETKEMKKQLETLQEQVDFLYQHLGINR